MTLWPMFMVGDDLLAPATAQMRGHPLPFAKDLHRGGGRSYLHVLLH